MRNVEPVHADYVASLNRGLDHVRGHLAEPLPLADVARAACFSPFHFHRIFKALMGETLHQFVQRQRLERALSLMSRAESGALTEIALTCGFASSSDFSRAFKQHFGVPPSRFDLAALRGTRRGELLDSMSRFGARPALDRLPQGENPDGFVVRLRDLPPRTLAYIRVHDPYRSGAVVPAVHRLIDWAEQRGLADGRWYGLQWEDPEVTALEDCRYDVAIEAGAELRSEGEVGCVRFPAMQVAEIELAGDIALELRALDWIYGTWLPRSGRRPADLPCFEAWKGRPFAHGYEHFELAVHLPLTT